MTRSPMVVAVESLVEQQVATSSARKFRSGSHAFDWDEVEREQVHRLRRVGNSSNNSPSLSVLKTAAAQQAKSLPTGTTTTPSASPTQTPLFIMGPPSPTTLGTEPTGFCRGTQCWPNGQ